MCCASHRNLASDDLVVIVCHVKFLEARQARAFGLAVIAIGPTIKCMPL